MENLTHIFLHSYIWTINSYESMQLICSILKPIIWYILCIAHVLTLIVYTIEVAAWTLVGVWYEKLPQKWGIWGVVGLKIDRYTTLIVTGMQMLSRYYNRYHFVINAYVATYYRMYLCYLPVVQDFNWCRKSLGSFLSATSESLHHYNYYCCFSISLFNYKISKYNVAK